MKLHRLPAYAVLIVVAAATACGADLGSDTAAKVGTQELAVPRLAEILNSSQAPLETEVARSIAELWVNYQLAGVAAARADTFTAPAEMDAGLWSAIDNMRVKMLYDQVKGTWDTTAQATDAERYAAGELLAARHILMQVGQDATPDAVEAARKRAEDIRAEATPANFARLAARSDEPGAGERGGDLGVFGAGTMVPDFETAVRAIEPGEISPVVRTAFGFHVIYRRPFAEVAAEVSPQLAQRNLVVAESLYIAKLEEAANVTLDENAAGITKDIARNTLGFRNDNRPVASFEGGQLTASRLADWVSAYPPQAQLRPQLINFPDSTTEQFVRQIVRNELLLRLADSAGMQADTAELNNLRLAFRNNLTMAWTTLGVEPNIIADSAADAGGREAAAGRIIDAYFDKLVKNEAQFADIAYPVAHAMQQKYEFAISDPGLERAIEQARQLRAAADSAPPSAAPPAGEMPAGEMPAGEMPAGETPPPSN